MAIALRTLVAGSSDRGRRRNNNEDRFHVDADRGIFFVVDGVGGHAAGEKAAETACTLLRERLERSTGSVVERIREAIAVANKEIFELSSANREWHGMACVLTVAVLEAGEITVGHVGDSRLYLIRKGEIRKVTHDHSPVGEREDRGEIDELTAMMHPRRNEVYRDVGSREHAPDDPDFIEIFRAPFAADNALLICSDGLTDLVRESQILSLVEANAGRPAETVQALIDAANEAGGKDNVTAVVVEGSQFARQFATSRTRSIVASSSPEATAERRLPHVGIMLAFLAGLACALGAVWLAKPHWMESDGKVQVGFGNVRQPRVWRVSEDLPAALGRAQTGDTIVVAPGSYLQPIQLKSGVSVVSERPREAILQTAGIAVAAENVNGARLIGFRILPPEGQLLSVGVHAVNSDIEVADLEVTGASTAAIELLGTSSGRFLASTIAGNPGVGILIRDQAKPRVVGNIVSGNGRGASGLRPGVEITGAAQPVLQSNLIENNGAEAIRAPQMNSESLGRQNFLINREVSKPNPRPTSSRPSIRRRSVK